MYKVIYVEPGQCRGGASPCLPTGKVWRASFLWWSLELMDDEDRVLDEKLDTSCWPANIKPCNRIMTLLTGWPVGEIEETYIGGLDANDIQTDTAAQPMWAIAVFSGIILPFTPLWMERCRCDSSLQRFRFPFAVMFRVIEELVCFFPRGMYS